MEREGSGFPTPSGERAHRVGKIAPDVLELNPVEGVWSLLTVYYLHNFGCHDLTQLKNPVAGTALALSSKPEWVEAHLGRAGYWWSTCGAIGTV